MDIRLLDGQKTEMRYLNLNPALRDQFWKFARGDIAAPDFGVVAK